MNDPKKFTLEGVRRLIGSGDDSRPSQLRVTTDGTACLSDVIGAEHLAGLAFRFETWDADNSYVGVQASQDDGWVQRIYQALRENWPKPKSTYIDSY